VPHVSWCFQNRMPNSIINCIMTNVEMTCHERITIVLFCNFLLCSSSDSVMVIVSYTIVLIGIKL
jgi:hypothetical protein